MIRFIVLVFLTGLAIGLKAQPNALVFQSDFGLKDGAVAAMKGVAFSVSRDLKMFDITHEIEAFNIWEAAYRLDQVARYWPAGVVFVSIVDPGVGSNRKSVVLKTKSGHYFVTPDNGTLTLIAESLGIEEVREIDEEKNRLPGSSQSYTFHGRDVYAYTGARLAAGFISFAGVGPVLKGGLVRLPIAQPTINGNEIHGQIPVLDVQYGNVWTNISAELLKSIGIKVGDKVIASIYEGKDLKYEATIPLVHTFGEVDSGKELAYFNSLLNFSLAVNQGNFANQYKIKSGLDWTVKLSKK
jgi:S-adenosylmethionine hydrolase